MYSKLEDPCITNFEFGLHDMGVFEVIKL